LSPNQNPLLDQASLDMARRQIGALLIFWSVGLVTLIIVGLYLGESEAMIISGVNAIGVGIIAFLRHRGHLQIAAVLTCAILLGSAIWGTWTTRLGLLDSTVVIFALTVVLGSLLLKPLPYKILMTCVVIAVLIIGFRTPLGLSAPVDLEVYTLPIDVAVVLLVLMFTAFCVRAQNNALWRTLRRAIENEQASRLANLELEKQHQVITTSEQRWRSLVDAAPDWIVQLDNPGTIIFANRRGFFPGPAEGQQLASILQPQDRARVAEAMATVLSTARSAVLELDVNHPDGIRHCTFHFGPLGSGNQPEGAIVLISDITERRNLELQLQQSQKLDSIGQLAGGVAHDFNNLLTVISGHADLGKMRLDPKHEAYRDLNTILEASENASALTSQILAFSRRRPLDPKAMDLSQTITTMRNMLLRLIGTDINLELSQPDKLPPVVADAGSLEQVVMNLVVNARDAIRAHPSPTSKTIRLETRLLMIDDPRLEQQIGLGAGPAIELTVADTGVGMEPDIKDRIFDPFFTTKDVGRGTGLGLATVYGIVKQSGGIIQVETEVEKGSCFKIYWPVTEDTVLDSLQAFTDGRDLTGTERLLLVEDNEAVSSLARSALTLFGYDVQVAEDGFQGLTAFQDHGPFDLVVTDVVMPNMDGFEMQRRLPENQPVLFTSGHADTSLLPDKNLQPHTRFLAKPFSPKELVAVVRTMLDEG